MVALKVSALLLALVAQCWTAPLEVLVDGANDTGTGFCVGDNVVFTCSLATPTHAWNVSGVTESISPSDTAPNFGGPDNRFTFKLVQSLTGRVITSFSLEMYAGFNGTSITCSDGLLQLNDTQTSTATVLGTPPAPTTSVTASADFQSFDVALTTTGPSARCVLQYSLTITENGQTMSTKNISSNGTGSVGDLNLCSNTYSFTAVAVTKDMSSGTSASVMGQVDFSDVSQLSGVRVDNGVVQWAISSTLPEECYGNYSLQLVRCKIEAFAILPAPDLNDAVVRTIFASISTAAPPTTSMAALNSTYYESVGVGDCVRPTVQTSISPANISGSLMLSSTESPSSTCNISLSSEGMASTSSQMTGCTVTDATTAPVTDVTTSTIAPTGSGGGDDGAGSGAVIGGVVGGLAVVIILVVIIIIVLVVLCKAPKREVKGQRLHPTPSSGSTPGHEGGDGGMPGDMRYDTVGAEPGDGAGAEYDTVTHGTQHNGSAEDQLPTYQDPNSIKRQAAAASGDIYTLPDKKDGKRKSVKNDSAPTNDIPLYSMPNKSKKHDPGLVYADIDVKKPAVSSRSRPPPPPQGYTTEQDANAPVIYSSVQLL